MFNRHVDQLGHLLKRFRGSYGLSVSGAVA